MPRLFTGIEIPAADRAELVRLKSPLPGAKWQEPDEMHLTLRFAGDIDNRHAGAFAEALSAIDLDVFEIRIAGLGAFGGNEPRTLWAGVEGGEALEQLARAHERAARQAGLQPDTRKFKPHITLARLRGTRVDTVANWLQGQGRISLAPFTVERFVLFSSRPKIGGGPYVVEEAYPLRGGMMGTDDDETEGW